jgi:energy-coupling factor transport system permease protein
MCGALYTAAIDPDELLRLLRHVSFRSALTATLATRMVPLLIRDSRRLADAQRSRPGPPPSRLTLMRAASSGVLDRALDVAAALEVRGFACATRPARAASRAYSRHDIAFLVSAAAVLALALAARLGGLALFSAYPSLHTPADARPIAVSAALIVCALAPFVDRRGIE